jgi:hypothetical protein
MANERRIGRYHTFEWNSKVAGGILSISGPDFEGGEIETSDADAGIFATYIPGRVRGSFSVEMNYVQDNAAQLDMQSDMLTMANRSRAFAIKPSATAASKDVSYTGTAIITGISFSRPEDDKQTMTATFRITGVVTKVETA